MDQKATDIQIINAVVGVPTNNPALNAKPNVIGRHEAISRLTIAYMLNRYANYHLNSK